MATISFALVRDSPKLSMLIISQTDYILVTLCKDGRGKRLEIM